MPVALLERQRGVQRNLRVNATLSLPLSVTSCKSLHLSKPVSLSINWIRILSLGVGEVGYSHGDLEEMVERT